MTKKKNGRPSLYKESYCKKMINWFIRELETEQEIEKSEHGKAVKIKVFKPNKPPMFGVFAREVLGVSHKTLIEWKNKHSNFREAYTECKVIQQEHIIMGCLMGIYSSTFGRFTLKNISTWRDNIDTHVSTDKGGFKLAYSLKGEEKNDSSTN